MEQECCSFMWCCAKRNERSYVAPIFRSLLFILDSSGSSPRHKLFMKLCRSPENSIFSFLFRASHQNAGAQLPAETDASFYLSLKRKEKAAASWMSSGKGVSELSLPLWHHRGPISNSECVFSANTKVEQMLKVKDGPLISGAARKPLQKQILP